MSEQQQFTKRQREILERLEQGRAVKEIATDLGVSRNAVYQQIERLKLNGTLPESYTPSGQPPRTTPRMVPGLELGAAVPAPGFPGEIPGTGPRWTRRSGLRDLRRPAGGSSREAAGDDYARLLERAIAENDVGALAYELGRLDAAGGDATVATMVEAALERLLILPTGGAR